MKYFMFIYYDNLRSWIRKEILVNAKNKKMAINKFEKKLPKKYIDDIKEVICLEERG